ncbi:hypothetical protein PUNSTDRAFT_76606 [Punctularia strigosozonata HHB-11173 SS5]|uniref:Integrase core domain-containing protein n=1 Tax=Punctularia strigosozonata (strain HHB-11173) TaxID=741275 RepID=R7S3E9_PUNST|nr:uncharacterized protein PUNSTDRAFT_76606 [Punctularia strigosozonata HHB-11173 SS5]EIN04394.1 hypothetical protein PUNSTDRAFT_76606 [Punctularia strigosozonata HHB-11173 SS5]
MDAHRGQGRGSYIWGRSVHNTRIERLWYDVTHGFGMKWKDFFLELETHHGLEPTNPDHIWLLHHLFLASINQDALEWAEIWNSHKMSTPGTGAQSPNEMFFFSMLQDGPRGLVPPEQDVHDDEDIEDVTSYGIDWDVYNDPSMVAHLADSDEEDDTSHNPFGTPNKLSEVICDAPPCPLQPHEVEALNNRLRASINISERDMKVRRLVWTQALAICHDLVSTVRLYTLYELQSS